MDAFLGQIMLFASPRNPVNWVECNGQLLAVSDYQALFSLLGTAYGGNGTTNFGVPDLRSRIPVGAGQGTGLTNRTLGSTGGVEQVILQTAEMPAHTHQSYATSQSASTNVPASALMLAATPSGPVPTGTAFYFDPPTTSAPTPVAMGAGTISPTPTGNQPHDNIMPNLALRYLICAIGLYPTPSTN